MSTGRTWSRRAVMCAGCSALAVGCGRSSTSGGKANTRPVSGGAMPTDTGRETEDRACAVTLDADLDGWVPISLDDHPELREPGGQVWISDPENLLYILLVCTEPGCWAAVWSTCTHGACIVEWDAEAAEVWCPCHGSRFGTDGRVLQGPATLPLTAFSVGERDGVLWVQRG